LLHRQRSDHAADLIDLNGKILQLRQRRLRGGDVGDAGKRGAQHGGVVADLLADIEAAHCHALGGGNTLLNNLLRWSSNVVEKKAGKHQRRDEPVEPVGRGGCRPPGRTLAGVTDCMGGGRPNPCCLVSHRRRCPRHVTERAEQAGIAEQATKTRGKRLDNVVFLLLQKADKTAGVQAPRAHNNRRQHSK
jgi:hypothetical protein